jgi:hypothetical protein
MKKFLISGCAVLALSACNGTTDQASMRQGKATRSAMNSADREVGMPRIANYAQRKLLKNAYEDMDQTTLTYVYSQAIDGRFVCLGQAVGYGVSLGTQFTAPEFPQGMRFGVDDATIDGTYMMAQPEPNGLFMPDAGAATIVNLVDPVTGKARTALIEPNVITSPNKLPASAVAVQCPNDVSAEDVSDAAETSVVRQR